MVKREEQRGRSSGAGAGLKPAGGQTTAIFLAILALVLPGCTPLVKLTHLTPESFPAPDNDTYPVEARVVRKSNALWGIRTRANVRVNGDKEVTHTVLLVRGAESTGTFAQDCVEFYEVDYRVTYIFGFVPDSERFYANDPKRTTVEREVQFEIATSDDIHVDTQVWATARFYSGACELEAFEQTWRTDDRSRGVLRVDEDGTLTGLATGTANLIVQAGSYIGTKTVDVLPKLSSPDCSSPGIYVRYNREDFPDSPCDCRDADACPSECPNPPCIPNCDFYRDPATCPSKCPAPCPGRCDVYRAVKCGTNDTCCSVNSDAERGCVIDPTSACAERPWPWRKDPPTLADIKPGVFPAVRDTCDCRAP